MEYFSGATPDELTHTASGHRPVLVHPLIQYLQPAMGQTFVDGTLGAGGMTAALLQRVLPGGRVLAIDRDPQAVARGRQLFREASAAVIVEQSNFAELPKLLHRYGIDAIDGAVLDLGMSSLQLDDPSRGFSFQRDGPLDMRFDTGTGTTAADIVNGWTEGDLIDLLSRYGNEPFAARIAHAIVQHRAVSRIKSTGVLRDIIEHAVPRSRWPRHIHPATKTFQALRIEVNDEIPSLQKGLQVFIDALRPGGRFGVISFHSLEDTLVKNTFHVAALNCLCPPQQPICTCTHRATLSLLSRRAIKADATELEQNPRARSARLRVVEKLAAS